MGLARTGHAAWIADSNRARNSVAKGMPCPAPPDVMHPILIAAAGTVNVPPQHGCTPQSPELARFRQRAARNFSTMNLTSLLAETQRKVLFLQQTQDAMNRERAHRIRNADLQSSAFVRETISPMLRNAEHVLMRAGLPAIATARIDENTARSMLTVSINENQALSLLAFEARLGSTLPRIRWTYGGLVHSLSDFHPAAVSGIVSDFLKSALMARE
jgi:hypothetical protein